MSTPETSIEPLLEARGLVKRFRRNGVIVDAVDGIDFTLAVGETLGVVGPSGSGKSTLARLVMRLATADSGTLRFQSEDLLALRGAALRRTRARLQMVFQDPLAAFNPRATAGHLIEQPLRIHKVAPRRDRPRAVAALLERVGLEPQLAARPVHEISGGQRQRVAIARAIASRPSLLVLDEAVSALDVSVRGQILDLLLSLQREEGLAYLFISHDLAVVRAVAHRVAVMDAGRIVETGDAAAVIAAPQSPIGRRLVSAVPVLKTDFDGGSRLEQKT